MTFQLASLPAEVIGQIVGYNDSSHLIMPLWSCGSSLLQHKIAQCATRIDLFSKEICTFAVLPSFIPLLRSLQTLIINRTNTGILYRLQDAIRILKSIGTRLQTLEINFFQSGCLFAPPGSPLALEFEPPFGPSFSALHYMADIFPNVKRLHISILDDASFQLPPMLEHLTLCMNVRHSATIANLPRTLLSLNLYYCDHFSSGCAEALPPLLTSLIVQRVETEPNNDDFIALLPKSLIHLELHYDYLDMSTWNAQRLASLLPALQYSNLLSSQTNASLFFPASPPPPAAAAAAAAAATAAAENDLASTSSAPSLLQPAISSLLPPSLRRIDIRNWFHLTLHHLMMLPSTLTDLTMAKTFTFTDGCLPKSLMNFCLTYGDDCHDIPYDPRHDFIELPSVLSSSCPSLLHFKSDYRIDPMVFSGALPLTLTEMDTFLGSSSELMSCFILPPTLVELSIPDHQMTYFYRDDVGDDYKFSLNPDAPPIADADPSTLPSICHSFPWSSLPHSVTVLQLPSALIPFSCLIYLPPHLKFLTAFGFVHDAEFNALDPSLLERVRYLRQASRYSENEVGVQKLDCSTSEMKRRVSIFELLPRSLMVLRIDGVDGLVPRDFGYLPALKALSIYSGDCILDPDCLFHLPMQIMKSLTINLVSIHGGHIKALGRNIRSLMLHVSDVSALRPLDALELPVLASHNFVGLYTLLPYQRINTKELLEAFKKRDK